MRKTISDLIMEYFRKHQKTNLKMGPVIDWVEERYLRLYSRKPRDTWRQIRRLYQEGFLIKVAKGIYKYDPDAVKIREIREFPKQVKEAVFARDGYRCVACGKGREEGFEIHADHRIPLEKGGSDTVDNAQTLCSECNLYKKTYSHTEFGKRFIIRLYHDAVKNNDTKMIAFCKDIFDVYNRHGINSHIKRPDKQ